MKSVAQASSDMTAGMSHVSGFVIFLIIFVASKSATCLNLNPIEHACEETVPFKMVKVVNFMYIYSNLKKYTEI